jgi:hypothetical protein
MVAMMLQYTHEVTVPCPGQPSVEAEPKTARSYSHLNDRTARIPNAAA